MAQSYVASPNETLWGIAQRFYGDGTFWYLIYEANKDQIGPDPAGLKAGQQLAIPERNAPPAPASPGERHYETQAGDTLWDIAQRFYGDGALWARLYEANRATIGADPQALFGGKRLVLPDPKSWGPPPNLPPAQSSPAHPVGSLLTGDAPAAVYLASAGALLTFANSGGALQQFSGGSWLTLGAPAAGITLSPGAAVRAPDTTHVAVRGGDGRMYQRYWEARGWSAWEDHGGELASGPALAAWSPARLDCFALGAHQNLIHCHWDLQAGWSAWEDVSPQLPDARLGIQFAPSVAAWGPNRLDIFAVAAESGELLHAFWDGGRWRGWERLGGVLTAAPSVVSRGPNLLDIYGRGSDGQIYHLIWDGYRWSSWLGLGRQAASAPAAAVTPQGVALFVRGQAGGVEQIL